MEVDDSQSRTAVAAAELTVEAVASRVAHLRESASSLERSIDMLTSEVSNAKSALSVAQRQMDQVPVRQWKDSPERAEATRDQTVLHHRRVEQLWLNGMVAKQELDDAAIAVRIAQNDLEMAQRAASASQQFGTAQEEQARLQTQLALLERRREQAVKAVNLQNATYELARAEADLAAAKRQLRNTVLQATTAGTVVELAVRPGDRLPQGAVLVRLAGLDRLVALIDVPARLVNGIRKGQRARLQLPPESAALAVDGEVRSVAPLPDTSGTHAVEVEFHNQRGLLLVSQVARVLFTQ